ncbi:MAG TPA: 23S rRNA (adenine(2030)-N(6))-methyltransferase RlmJ [Pseudolabrys sp.]|nr:23S rRNA (adenine(2030)-N(6))-methyltransferase RlmJ [Pseudolabrys sp.]
MNYRHAFHAGNFADVLKHVVLSRVLVHLREKAGAFRVVDTHAGAGLYDLSSNEATRGGEWQNGIGRLLDATLPKQAAELLAPYLDAIRALNPPDRLRHYPGSPVLAQHFLRKQDRLIACELEPNAASALRRSLRGDDRAKAIEIDGWTGLTAYIPPVERRGVVLIDPPFEEKGDYTRLANALDTARRKWASGAYLLWYPIKGRPEPDALAKRIRRFAIPKVMRVELTVSPLSDPTRLNGCGLIVLNPPWKLADELAGLLPILAGVLAPAGKGASRLDWLTAEAPATR